MYWHVWNISTPNRTNYAPFTCKCMMHLSFVWWCCIFRPFAQRKNDSDFSHFESSTWRGKKLNRVWVCHASATSCYLYMFVSPFHSILHSRTYNSFDWAISSYSQYIEPNSSWHRSALERSWNLWKAFRLSSDVTNRRQINTLGMLQWSK